MIKIEKNGLCLDYKRISFPGGELGVQLNVTNAKYWRDEQNSPHVITARITNAADYFELALIVDSIRQHDPFDRDIILVMPYCPNARQDRVCSPGDAFGLQVFAKQINALNFKHVVVCDPHSNVMKACFREYSLLAFNQLQLIQKNFPLVARIQQCIPIAPDEGAIKKTMELTKYCNLTDFAISTKIRNLATGEIIGISINRDDFGGRDVVMVDDICDGGRTFTELAAILRKKNVGKIVLYVTHGIFSKGVDVLFQNGIDEIWTTDSYAEKYDSRVNVFQLPLKEMLEARFKFGQTV